MEIIYIDGTFDLLHTGHIKLLKRLKNEVLQLKKNSPNL